MAATAAATCQVSGQHAGVRIAGAAAPAGAFPGSGVDIDPVAPGRVNASPAWWMPNLWLLLFPVLALTVLIRGGHLTVGIATP